MVVEADAGFDEFEDVVPSGKISFRRGNRQLLDVFLNVMEEETMCQTLYFRLFLIGRFWQTCRWHTVAVFDVACGGLLVGDRPFVLEIF